MLTKITNLVKRLQFEIFVVLVLVFVSAISYNIGAINSLKKSPIKIGEDPSVFRANIAPIVQEGTQPEQTANRSDRRVVISKKSTSKKYHYSWCAGAKQIKEENRVWFNSESDAIAAGYSLAGNCN